MVSLSPYSLCYCYHCVAVSQVSASAAEEKERRAGAKNKKMLGSSLSPDSSSSAVKKKRIADQELLGSPAKKLNNSTVAVAGGEGVTLESTPSERITTASFQSPSTPSLGNAFHTPSVTGKGTTSPADALRQSFFTPYQQQQQSNAATKINGDDDADDDDDDDEKKPPAMKHPHAAAASSSVAISKMRMAVVSSAQRRNTKTKTTGPSSSKDSSNNINKREALKRKIRGVMLLQKTLQEDAASDGGGGIIGKSKSIIGKIKDVGNWIANNIFFLCVLVALVFSNLPDDHHLDQDPPLVVAIIMMWYFLVKIWGMLSTKRWFRQIIDPITWGILVTALWAVQNITMIAIFVLIVFSFMPDDHHLELDPPMMLAITGVWYITKSVWAGVPNWLRKKMEEEEEEKEDDVGKSSDRSITTKKKKRTVNIDNEDLTSPNTIWKKLNEMFDLTYEHTEDIPLERYNIYVCFFSLLHLLTELYLAEPEWHDDMMRSEGKKVMKTELQTLQFYLEFADFAYETSNTELMNKLHALSLAGDGTDKDGEYFLIRHDVATEPGRVGHFIAVNHTKREVVIAIKGTSSLSDVLTDLVGKAIPHSLPNGVEIRCHEGMHQAAITMLEDTCHLVEHFFLTQNYKIIICGHSLGAGVSSLLGVMLHALNIPVQVYAYATPACLSFDASMSCQNYITSIVNNDDCVPRVSLATIRNLMKVFVHIDERLKKLGRSPNGWSSTKAYMRDIAKIDTDTLMSAQELIEVEKNCREDVNNEHALFVPGRVVSIWECDTTSTNTPTEQDGDVEAKTATVDCRQLHGGLSTLRHIEVSTTMLGDHGTANYKKNIASLINFECV